jgi:hypothetical protein
MFIARKNIAARLWSFPRRIINNVRDFLYAEKIKYCEDILRPRVEKANLIRECVSLSPFSAAVFNKVAGALEWNVANSTPCALLAANILRDIAQREAQFRAEHGSLTNFMLDDYRERIIKEILTEGDFAEEKIRRLLKIEFEPIPDGDPRQAIAELLGEP